MKRNIIFLLLLLSCSISAQTRYYMLPSETDNQPCNFDPVILLDSVVRMECVYAFSEMDTVRNEGLSHTLIVQLGEKVARQVDINWYLQDSVYVSRDYKMTWKEALDVTEKYFKTYRKEFMRYGDVVQERHCIALTNTQCMDSDAVFKWRIYEDTMTVCGYLCHKAVTHFRGRTWTVWYADELPIEGGPWKLHGLPGLILKATDTHAIHDFEAIEVRSPHMPRIMMDERTALRKVTRKKFRELELHFVLDPIGALEGSGLIESTTAPNDRMFYSPLELE